MNEISCTYQGEKIKIKINDKFNRLRVIDIFKDKYKYYAKCECDCGKVIDKIVLRSLLSENTKSCGCLNSELTIQRNLKHGMKTREKGASRLYGIWSDMRRRCNNVNRKNANNYALKGIKVCQEWDNFSNFYHWSINNGYNEALTLERKDNSLGYNPDNCCWISKSEQAKNRTTNHYITYNGETKTLTDWAKTLDINRTTLQSRLRRGWTIEQAFSTHN